MCVSAHATDLMMYGCHYIEAADARYVQTAWKWNMHGIW